MERPSEVLVPDTAGKYWVVWDSRDAHSGVALPASGLAHRAA